MYNVSLWILVFGEKREGQKLDKQRIPGCGFFDSATLAEPHLEILGRSGRRNMGTLLALCMLFPLVSPAQPSHPPRLPWDSNGRLTIPYHKW